MVSARAKGNATERRAQLELEEEGWITQRAPPASKFSKQTDLFGLFDILALKLTWSTLGANDYFKNYKTQERKWIQAKTNSLPTKEWKEKAKEFKEKYCCCFDSVEIWTYWQRGRRKKKQGWEKIIL